MQFLIGTAIALAAAYIAYITWQSQVSATFKRIHYSGSTVPLAFRAIPEDLMKRIQLNVAGQNLIYPVLHVIRLENTGKAPVRPDDFGGPLRIRFDERSWICQGAIKSSHPDMIKFESGVKIDGSEISFAPMLLNPGDHITLLVIVDGIPAKPQVTARIAGVQEILDLPVAADSNDSFTLNVTSAIPGRAVKDWPQKWPEATVLAMPFLLTSNQWGINQIGLSIDGTSVDDPHYLALIISMDPDHETTLIPPLILRWSTSSIMWARFRSEKRMLDDDLHGYVEWNERELRVLKIPTFEGDTLSVILILSGNGTDVEVADRPEFIRDVQLAVADFGDVVERNVANTRPHLLLANRWAYRTWARISPAIIQYPDQVLGTARRWLLSLLASIRS